MRFELCCPACGVSEYDFDDYISIVLLAPNLAMTQYSCPRCGINLSVTIKLSPEMQHRIQMRMNEQSGNSVIDTIRAENLSVSRFSEKSYLSYASSLIVSEDDPDIEFIPPFHIVPSQMRSEVENFKQQLETLETVDDAIWEIGLGFDHETRDV